MKTLGVANYSGLLFSLCFTSQLIAVEADEFNAAAKYQATCYACLRTVYRLQ